MKKYSFILVLVAVLLLTGCGKKQLVCTGTQVEDGVTVKGKVVADLDKDDKITDAVVTYDLGDKKTAETYCAILKLMEDEKKGISISCSGTKITIKGFAKLDSDDEDDGLLGASREEFIKAMEEEKFTCK